MGISLALDRLRRVRNQHRRSYRRAHTTKEVVMFRRSLHVVPGDVRAADVVNLQTASTVQGTTIDISVNGGGVMVDEANVVQTDIVTSNGVIHVIDSVILP
ncbi:MAG: hypothetical protein CME19_07360 [Gemmatimonadetes bacterium]|nr:hypothetical protein [Gemmatimonadota bacterium]